MGPATERTARYSLPTAHRRQRRVSNIYSHNFFADLWKLPGSLQESNCKTLSSYQGQTTIRTEPKEGFTVCVRERKLRAVLGLNNYYTELLLHF